MASDGPPSYLKEEKSLSYKSKNLTEEEHRELDEIIQFALNFTSSWAPSVVMGSTETPGTFLNTTSNDPLIHLIECVSPINCTNVLNYSKSLSDLTNFTKENLDNYTEEAYVTVPNASGIVTVNSTNSLSSNGSSPKNVTTLFIEPDLKIHYPLLACFLAVICLLVIFGNVLIMIAIKRERYLHTVTNYFIASLAAADCLVGVVVMPFSVVHEVMNKWWIFGQDWCDLWHSFDVLASTASILNLCAISVDRYWAITDPMSYPAKMTPNKAVAFIAAVWTCSALISFPAIIWWRATMIETPPRYQCQWTEDIGYLVFSSLISFYVPLTVMLFVYYRIYKAAVDQTRSVKLGTKQIQTSDRPESAVTLRIHRGGVPTNVCRTKHASDCSGDESADFIALDENGLDLKGVSVRHRNVKAWSMGRKLAKLAKEKKAAKTLGIVMGVFILCWLPFFITNVVMGICAKTCLNDSTLVHSVVTWLGWLNSGMNPVIYACWSRDFRRAFKKILCCCCHKEAYRRNRKFKQARYSYSGDQPNPKSSSGQKSSPKCQEAIAMIAQPVTDHKSGRYRNGREAESLHSSEVE